MDLLLLTLAAALLGLVSFGLGSQLLEPMLGALGTQTVILDPSEPVRVQLRLGLACVLPALALWQGALVHRLRADRLPEPAAMVLMWGFSATAVVVGFAARLLMLQLVLPSFAVVGVLTQVSLGNLELGAWAARAGLVSCILSVSWAGLRKLPGSPRVR